MNMPTVKQLRYLVALDEVTHFGKAAEACRVSQPAFSMAIKEVETLLGVQLVDRTNKSVTMTEAGRQVAQNARICLNDLTNLVHRATALDGPLAGKLTLGIIPTIAPFVLPSVMKAIAKQYPDLKLFLKERMTLMLYDELMAGYLDAILVALPYDFKHVEILPLYRDYFHLAYREDTTWLEIKESNIPDLKPESVLLLEDGHCLREHTLSACKLRNTDKVNQFCATGLYTLLNMVENDMGVTFLPQMAEGSTLLKNSKIKMSKLHEDSYRKIGLVWRKNSAQRAEFEALGELIRNCR
ncbi:MAG: LysR substrate-binding domain-containing protein [Methylococcaceae bacterium]